jgi:hypothetical protein
VAIEGALDAQSSPARTGPSRWLDVRTGLAIVFAACLALLVAEHLNHRFAMVDFQVFYKAGQRILRGENLYRHVEDGFYEYKYGPVAAFLFSPFAPLPRSVASVAYWFFLAGVLTGNLFLCLRLVRPDYGALPRARVGGVVLLAALTEATHLIAELHLGQVNQLLLALYLLMALALMKRRPIAFALPMAASLYLKPFALAFVPYLLLKKRHRELAWVAVLAIALGLAPLLVFGPGELVRQYRGWMDAIALEMASKTDLLRPANHTLFSVAVRYSPLRLLPMTGPILFWVRLGIVGALGALMVAFMRWGRAVERPEPAEFALLLSLIPLLAYTSSNAFGSTMLALFVLFFAFGRLGPGWRVAIALGALLLGGNHWDLWGKELFVLFEQLSLVTVGAVLLVAALARGRLARVF